MHSVLHVFVLSDQVMNFLKTFPLFANISSGSIGWSSDEALTGRKYLKWSDVKITRTAIRCAFEIEMTFSLKTMGNKLPARGGNHGRPLICQISSPQLAKNIIFSCAHRLLVAGLHKGFFVGIENLDDIFDKKNHEFVVCKGLVLKNNLRKVL